MHCGLRHNKDASNFVCRTHICISAHICAILDQIDRLREQVRVSFLPVFVEVFELRPEALCLRPLRRRANDKGDIYLKKEKRGDTVTSPSELLTQTERKECAHTFIQAGSPAAFVANPRPLYSLPGWTHLFFIYFLFFSSFVKIGERRANLSDRLIQSAAAVAPITEKVSFLAR